MVRIESHTENVGFPVYGAKFQNDKTLVVAGGGGEGNNGVPNKIAVLNVDEKETVHANTITEFEIEGKNDSPTSLDVNGNTVLIGCNENTANIKSGNNKHLRKYIIGDENKVTFESSADIEKSTDPNDYQKLVVIAKDDSIAAVVSSKVPSTIKVIDPKTLKVLDVIDEKEEINDVDISPDSKKIAYVTNKKLVVVENSEKPILKHDRFAPNYNLAKVKFNKDGELIIGINLKNNYGVLLSHVVILEDKLKVKKSKVLSHKTPKITSLDISEELAAVSGNDSSIIIVGLDHFDVYKHLKDVHSFAITEVVFSPNGKYLASTSVSNTVNVIKIPIDIAKSYFWLKFHFVVVLIAIALYYFKVGVFDVYYDDGLRLIYDTFGDDFFYYENPQEIAAQNEARRKELEDSVSTETITETETIEEIVTEVTEEVVTVIKKGDIVEISTVSSANTADDVYQDASSLI